MARGNGYYIIVEYSGGGSAFYLLAFFFASIAVVLVPTYRSVTVLPREGLDEHIFY